ncbi:substrate-binding periplasmic protein [Aestuariispira insulae]|uniref:Amino acid ABC transporter substrate-binding protein (PAAT family) n=1 Tax=Aestuariispira insulae TaxID=1461337 RepID=A0A3D9H2L2_9PROT|nr:transporter substrate-binding domain-containing protein [Aestuariispira insulae]RED43401.1 amino acid ABC transporter substrate-binding protein (PAAT family) [Aestuariispira insulae]
MKTVFHLISKKNAAAICTGMMLFFLLPYPAIANDGNIIRLVQDPWPPITSEKISGEGLATDIVTKAFRIAGYDPKVETIPWKRALVMVETLKSDAIVAAYHNDDRAQKFDYSLPYLVTPILFLKRRETNISYNSLEDLRNVRIGIIRSASNGNEFDQADFLNKIELSNPSVIIRMLYYGRVDIAPFTNVVGMHLINTRFSQWSDEFEFFGRPLAVLRYYLIIGKAHPKKDTILKDFNMAIMEMKSDGTIQEIIAAHNLMNAFPRENFNLR